ncbi:dehydratase [Sphingobacterium sp. ML3W]|uniref:NAD-dependent epimerase/dehydratase family protein n=1 Tax=Sphingobacterium sp. ML3W TaxID=1538644 RepID=UPI0004F87449|nr:NAD-dependent epimerase/dehydratase family protein [Sphingobacterium sp. ML3W]AIM39163.1 dehydratase [Sphingobacterium sp. ML3W]
MTKVVITGASGFVGQNLMVYLQKSNIEVVSLSLRHSDWAQHQPLDGTAIIHLAGKAHDTSDTSDSDAYFKINRDLTIELFNVFLKSNVRDFFYFSSVKAVADTVGGMLDENIVGYPQTPYGKSKLEAEEYLLKQMLPYGKRIFIIRPCMIHGPGNKGNLNLLYKVVEKGLPWPLASFNNQRSFVSIDNLNYLIEEMLSEKSVPSGIYNFADDETLSTNDLVSVIAHNLNRSPRLCYISPTLIKNMVRIGDFIPFPLNSERLKKLTESYVVSNDKIKKALRIDRLPLTAREGLEITFKSFSDKS